MNITVYLGASDGADKVYEREARALGEWIGSNGHHLIYGGSRAGLMGVIADAVLNTGGEVTGVEPGFFVEAELQHEGISKLIITETMAERRAKMIEMGEAFIAFPGGTGTLEEIAEVISMRKIGLIHEPVILLNLEGYYDHLEKMLQKMVEEGFLSQKDLNKISFVRSVDSVCRLLSGDPDPYEFQE